MVCNSVYTKLNLLTHRAHVIGMHVLDRAEKGLFKTFCFSVGNELREKCYEIQVALRKAAERPQIKAWQSLNVNRAETVVTTARR